MSTSNERSTIPDRRLTRSGILHILAWPLLCLMLAAGLWYWTITHIETTKKSQEKKALAEATALCKDYTQYLIQAVEQANQITLQVHYAWEQSLGQPDLQKQMKGGLFRSPRLKNLLILDRDGKLVASIPDAPRSVSFTDRDYFSYHKNDDTGELLIGKPLISRLSGTPVITFTRRLHTPQGAFDGIALVAYELQHLTAFCAGSFPGKSGLLLVAGLDGTQRSASVGQGTPDPQSPPLRAVPLFNAPEGAALLIGEQWFGDRQSRYVAWKTLEQYPLVAVVGISEQEYFAPLQSEFSTDRGVAITGSIILCLFALAAAWISRRLVRRRQQEEETRAAYRLATEGGSEGYFLYEAIRSTGGTITDFELVDCNERGAGFYGMEQRQLLHLKLSDLHPATHFDKTREIFRQALATGFFEDEIQADHEWKLQIGWAKRRLVRSDSGLAVTVQDYSERKRNEALLQETRDLFTLFMKYSPIYTFIKEIDGAQCRVIELSDNFIDMVGIPAAELRGRTMEEIFPADFARKITEDDLTVISQGKEVTLEESFNGLDYITVKFPITREGQSSLLAGFTINITDRKQAEKRLRESEERIRRMSDAAGAYLWEVDANMVYTFVSELSAQVKGFPPEALLGHTPLEFMHREDLEPVGAIVGQALANKATFRLQHRDIGPDGEILWEEVYGAAYCDELGNIVGLRGTGININERKKAEEEQLQLERQLLHVQKLESLGVLAGGIAHDFNNILTAIIGNTELALMRLNPESPVLENLSRIEKAAARAADLAKQMLAYSGKGKFVVEAIDLNRLVHEMGHILEASISKKAEVRYNLAPSLPAVNADATQIRQIIMNLVINASEAIGDTSGVIAITSGCLECNEAYLQEFWLTEPIPEGLYVSLEIADTGCGMDEATLAKIFDPFFTTKFTGRGLGMAAVLGIVRSHKGAIKVYSEPGKGSSFKVLLPAGEKSAALFIGETAGDRWRGYGVALLVDDEETIRAIGGEMLRELGFEVITATDGRDAVEKYTSRNDIRVVILDLTMPHMDGEQCFRELQQLNPEIKVIISSGFSEHEVTQKFTGKGLVGFVQKPYKFSVLREAIKKIDN